MTPFEISWSAPEFEYREKDLSWYWLSIIIAVVVLGFAVWQKNFLFAFFVVIAEVLVLTWANREPLETEFKLSDKALTISGGKFYYLNEFENFSFGETMNDEWPTLIFRFSKRLRPPLRVAIPKGRTPEIREVLSQIVREVEHEESLSDSLENFFRF